jgi:hypothetical protein
MCSTIQTKKQKFSQQFLCHIRSLVRGESPHYCHHGFQYENHFDGYQLKRVRFELGYNRASSIVIWVPIGSMIVARLEPTIIASCPPIVKTFPCLLVRI